MRVWPLPAIAKLKFETSRTVSGQNGVVPGAESLCTCRTGLHIYRAPGGAAGVTANRSTMPHQLLLPTSVGAWSGRDPYFCPRQSRSPRRILMEHHAEPFVEAHG